MTRPAAVRQVPATADRATRLFLQALAEQSRDVQAGVAAAGRRLTTVQLELLSQITVIRETVREIVNTPAGPPEPRRLTVADSVTTGSVLVPTENGIVAATGPTDAVIGLSGQDGSGEIIYAGPGDTIEKADWTWTIGALLWVDDDGLLSETPGTEYKPVAVALTATKLLVLVGESSIVESDESAGSRLARTTTDGVLHMSVAVPHGLTEVPEGTTVQIPAGHALMTAGVLNEDGALLVDGAEFDVSADATQGQAPFYVRANQLFVVGHNRQVPLFMDLTVDGVIHNHGYLIEAN